MTQDFYKEIKSELADRKRWEEKQAAWYQMRYEGIKRARKPYKNAPDMHYPLVDTMCEKIKPFYISQIYDKERLATFVSETPHHDSGQAGLNERLFDYTIKQKTNFEQAIYTSIDHMLMYGRGPMKVFWDADKNIIRFSPIRPIHLIVPSWTEDSGDADWLVHVIHVSEAQYRRNSRFNQNNDFIKSIKGKGDGVSQTQEQAILRRNGITCGMNDHQIVLWECYSRDKEGNIIVETISPMAGIDKPVRNQFPIPYDHGQFPFVDLRYELADPDYYSPRGLAEILAHFELDLCKLWNQKLQFLDFHGQPQYKNTGGSANPTNFSNEPGRILPQGIDAVEPRSAPLDFKEEMQLQRALAEDRVQTPDLNAGEHLAGNRGANGKVTATQINAIMQLSSGGNDMRGRVFRLQLGVLYKQAQSLIDQFLSDPQQRVLEDFTQVPVSGGTYRVTPSGSGDSSSKEQRMAKGIAYYQTLQQNPSIPLPELTKWLLEQDGADLVKRLWKDPGLSQLQEGEKQAMEILLMDSGYPAIVNEGDDDKAHLNTIAQWMERRRMSGEHIKPETAAHLLEHAVGQNNSHATNIKKKRDKFGMALLRQLAPYVNVLEQIVQQAKSGAKSGVIDDSGMPAQSMPAVPGPQGGPAQAQTGAGSEAAGKVSESISINYKDAPPSIRRQIEGRAGFIPATPDETNVEHMTNVKAAQPKPAPEPKLPATPKPRTA